MKVILPDQNRRYELPGTTEPAWRPVDIDISNTGFTRLRSLRLYRFNAESVVDGHAEEEEVFVVLTSGCVEMKIGWENSAVDAIGTYKLAAPLDANETPFVVYLPPHSVYQLTTHTIAEVAYARATALGSREPTVFAADASMTGEGVATLLEVPHHAERLQLRVFRVRPDQQNVTFDLLREGDAGCEVLVHVQGLPNEHIGRVSGDDGTSLHLRAWETLALNPGERAILHTAPRADLLILMMLAA